MGINSSIGNTVGDNFYALTHRQAGISRIENVATIHADHIKVGEIKHTNNELITALGLPEVNAYSRTSLLGIIALQEAIANAKLTSKDLSHSGLIITSTMGGMDMTENYFFRYGDEEW